MSRRLIHEFIQTLLNRVYQLLFVVMLSNTFHLWHFGLLLTLKVFLKGTPLYMSPELVEEKPYDHTADLWYVFDLLFWCKDMH